MIRWWICLGVSIQLTLPNGKQVTRPEMRFLVNKGSVSSSAFNASLREALKVYREQSGNKKNSLFKSMKIFHLYILKCNDGTYYTGMTSNLERRIQQHKTSYYKDSYTSSRLPVELVFYCQFQNVLTLIEKEKQIKSWSKAKKEALINGDYDLLPNLAKKKF